MIAISHTEARATFATLLDRIVADRAPVAITRPRGEGVVLVAASEWESIEETLYLLRSPANAKHLMDGIREFDGLATDP